MFEEPRPRPYDIESQIVKARQTLTAMPVRPLGLGDKCLRQIRIDNPGFGEYRAVEGTGVGNGHSDMSALGYGNSPLSPKPRICVITVLSIPQGPLQVRTILSDNESLLRRYIQAGPQHDQPRAAQCTVRVDDNQVNAMRTLFGHHWLVRVEIDELHAAVLGRTVAAVNDLVLERVRDLEPYLHGSRSLLRQLSRKGPP